MEQAVQSVSIDLNRSWRTGHFDTQWARKILVVFLSAGIWIMKLSQHKNLGLTAMLVMPSVVYSENQSSLINSTAPGFNEVRFPSVFSHNAEGWAWAAQSGYFLRNTPKTVRKGHIMTLFFHQVIYPVQWWLFLNNPFTMCQRFLFYFLKQMISILFTFKINFLFLIEVLLN